MMMFEDQDTDLLYIFDKYSFYKIEENIDYLF